MPTPITEVIRSGLTYERSRLEAASLNLATANIALAPGAAPAARKLPLPAGSFSASLGSVVPGDLGGRVKTVHDPAHPYADAQGMVRYPDVDPTHEMATLVAATRAYEANVRAFNTIHQMASKALEIGGRK